MRRRVVAVAVAVAAVAPGLTACAGNDTPNSGSPSVATGDTSQSPTVPGTETGSASSPAPVPTTWTYDRTYKWPDGLNVLVTAPAEFTPSPAATVGAFTSFVQIDVSIEAGAQGFDSSRLSAAVQSGGSAGERVLDPADGFAELPAQTVLPGREVSFRLGFGVRDPADVALELVADPNHAAVTFTR